MVDGGGGGDDALENFWEGGIKQVIFGQRERNIICGAKLIT